MTMRLAYGRDRKAPDFNAYDVKPERFFLDHGDEVEELGWLLKAVREGDVVVILAKGDLGKGLQISKRIEAIEKAGATIEWGEPPKDPKNVKKNEFDDDQLVIACKIWDHPLLSTVAKLARIEQATGIKMDRQQMYHRRRKLGDDYNKL